MVVFVFVVVFAIHRLALAATDVDAASETMTSGAFPHSVRRLGRGHAPLTV